MRRTDRELHDFDEIVKVLAGCDVLRVGMRGETYPYVVPFSFGYEVRDNKLFLYIHGAREGQKNALLEADGHVCVEADRFDDYYEAAHGVSVHYESVIGFGIARRATGSQAARGLRLLMAHCGYADKAMTGCGGPVVYEIEVETITGKRNA